MEDNKKELTCEKIIRDTSFWLRMERSDYSLALMTWLIVAFLLSFFLSFFIGGWIFLSMLIPIPFGLTMCVKFSILLKQAKNGDVTLLVDNLLYRKTEKELDLYTFITNIGTYRTQVRYEWRRGYKNVEVHYFESGMRFTGFAADDDNADMVTEKPYYVILVGNKRYPVVAYSMHVYKLSPKVGFAIERAAKNGIIHK